eukprot:CAMPEP_0171456066 /NCGR_PEP_ID=MMETSP0945-20130129/2710_1 /TAXON_ID=109269 /ORGANISM="Vaucheria litorea, Strain CCMP2940" /LENGTH=181 /DNA_ID=CAMNT_0011981433 /DNA_START=1 /DNA_END=546 /DNA_ORIENTATION=+
MDLSDEVLGKIESHLIDISPDTDSENSAVIPDHQFNNLTHYIRLKVELDAKLDLKSVAFAVRNAEYEPKLYSGLKLRMSKPWSVAVIYPNGSMMVGAYQKDVLRSAKMYVRILEKFGFIKDSLSVRPPTICLTKSYYDLGFNVRLAKFARDFVGHVLPLRVKRRSVVSFERRGRAIFSHDF